MLDDEGVPTSSKKKIDTSQSVENLTVTMDGTKCKKSETEDSKPKKVPTVRSGKSDKTRSKWEWTDDNDSSKSQDKSHSVSENEEVSNSFTPKRSSRLRDKVSSGNVLINAIDRKEKSYSKTASPQRLSRRIKPTAKVPSNEKLRTGLESQNNARLGSQVNKPQGGKRTPRSAQPAVVEQSVDSKGIKSSTAKEGMENQEDSEKLRHLCELGLQAKDTKIVEEEAAEDENGLEVVYIIENPEGPHLEVPLNSIKMGILHNPNGGTSDGAGTSGIGEGGGVPLNGGKRYAGYESCGVGAV